MKLNFNVFRTMILSAMLLCGIAAEARVISGTVKDPTGETIISASVVVKGTTIGTVTDFDGNYTLDVPDDATVLVFSYIGMQTQELTISGAVMDVVLSENSEVLEEVVVTGYGTTKKRDLVTSVASVSAEQLKDVPVASAAAALEGKLAGVSVTAVDGAPDAELKIRVRGGTSLTQSSDPLYIVDGFPVSSISDIAPSDIASVDVLKDAAATAIYGAQGANGVIIITTKEPVTDGDDKMSFHVDYSGYAGWKKVAHKYSMLGTRDFILAQREWQAINKPDGTTSHTNQNNYFYSIFDPDYTPETTQHMAIADILDYWEGKETDWQDRTFGNTGFNSNHTFTINGGNSKNNFSLSYNRVDDKGVVYGSDYNRNNISFKSKFQPVKNLTISVKARYTNTNVLGSGMNPSDDAGSKSEGRVRNAVAYTPIPVKPNGDEGGGDDEDRVGNLYDPITTINDNYKSKKDDKWSLDGYIQYKFLKNFTVKADLGYESRDVATNRYYGKTTYYSMNSVSAYTSAGLGNVIVTDDKSSRLKHTGSFDWKQTFDKHSFEIFAAEEVIYRKQELRTEYGYGYDTHLTGASVFEHLGQGERYVTTTYVYPNDNQLSLIGRFDYNYAGRYYATLTFRADASSKFNAKNRWGYFPSAALAWRIIDEEWMAPAQSVMSNFKLRATYGLVGNNNVDLGYSHIEYNEATAVNSGLGYATQYYIGKDKIAPNENLKWETTTSRNLGLDFGFWNERLSGSVDVYCNSTRDLLLLYKLAGSQYDYQYRNIGSTQNIGVEVSLTGVILDHRAKDLSYKLAISANLAHNDNRVKDLGGLDEYLVSTQCFSDKYVNRDYEFRLVPGGRVGDIYGYKTDGFYTINDFDKGSVANGFTKEGKSIATPLGNARPGMPKIVGERQVIGNTQPIINGGFNLSFNIGGAKWGKVDFSANFTYSVGNSILNLSALDYSTVTEKTRLRNLSSSTSNRYTFLDEDYNVVKALNFNALAAKLNELNANATEASGILWNNEEFALTDKYVEDGSFLRLSSLNIGYTLPDKVLQKAHMTTCRIFFTASNLFCVTKYSGADPEVDTRSNINPLATGVDYSAYPKSRSFNFGLSIGF